MSATNIVLERETANDESALVVSVLAVTGSVVQRDDLIFEVENSKAVQELRAPETGILAHYLEVGQSIDFGVPIAQIVSADVWAEIVARVDGPEAVEATAEPRAEETDRDIGAVGIEIMLERETANDETAVVVAVPIASGTAVEKDALIFEIENSKAAQELVAPQTGILVHALSVGDVVGFGVRLARIVPLEAWNIMNDRAGGTTTHPASLHKNEASATRAEALAALPTPPKPDMALTARGPAKARLSRSAAVLVAEHGLDVTVFRSSFVTSQDVRAYLAPAMVAPQRASSTEKRVGPSIPPAGGIGKRQGHPVGRGKRSEIETLSRGAGESMLSVLGVSLGALQLDRDAGDFLEGRITDLLIYEASRLMKKYPKLNASYADGQILLHEPVHAGLAIDSGGRLVVYGIEHSDKLSLPEIADTMALAVERYLGEELTGTEMSRATFTVTDLSADNLDFVFPLLPRGQSCILAVTHSRRAGFQVFAGFDHRVTEGREVGSFLGELQSRLHSFATTAPTATVKAIARCVYCERSAEEAVARGKEKGLLKTVDRSGQEVLCCGSCWNGW